MLHRVQVIHNSGAADKQVPYIQVLVTNGLHDYCPTPLPALVEPSPPFQTVFPLSLGTVQRSNAARHAPLRVPLQQHVQLGIVGGSQVVSSKLFTNENKQLLHSNLKRGGGNAAGLIGTVRGFPMSRSSSSSMPASTQVYWWGGK